MRHRSWLGAVVLGLAVTGSAHAAKRSSRAVIVAPAQTGPAMVVEATVTTEGGRTIPLVFQTDSRLDATSLPPSDTAPVWIDPVTNTLTARGSPGSGRVFVLRAQRLLEHLNPGDTAETSTLLVEVPRSGASIDGLRVYLHVDARTSTKPLYEAQALTGQLRRVGNATLGEFQAALVQRAPEGEAGGWVRLSARMLLDD